MRDKHADKTNTGFKTKESQANKQKSSTISQLIQLDLVKLAAEITRVVHICGSRCHPVRHAPIAVQLLEVVVELAVHSEQVPDKSDQKHHEHGHERDRRHDSEPGCRTSPTALEVPLQHVQQVLVALVRTTRLAQVVRRILAVFGVGVRQQRGRVLLEVAVEAAVLDPRLSGAHVLASLSLPELDPAGREGKKQVLDAILFIAFMAI